MRVKGASVTRDEKQQATALIETIEDNFLTQCIREPTRGGNILDLIITNSSSLVHSYEVRSTIMSDHNLICVKADINNLARPVSPSKQAVSQVSLEGYNFYSKDVDWDQLKKELHEINWHSLLQGREDVNVPLHKVTQKCQETCSKYFPKKREAE